MNCDSLYINARIASFSKDFGKGYATIEEGAIATTQDKITWVGHMRDLPKITAKKTIDVQKKWITPGLIDCHTHIIYAGNRSNEFEDRLNGVDYKEIAKRGGGILATVASTRQASIDTLLQQSIPRIKNLLQEGVTTLEIKSGYGLDYENEHKMLAAADKVSQLLAVNVKRTFLGAHALPAEYENRSDDYIDLICHHMLPKLHQKGLVDAVDAFCETIGFSTKQVERVFEVAKSLSLPVKLHAEQLSNQEGSSLVAHYKGLSADHLEYLSENGISQMKKSKTVAVLLPGAFYTLRETKLPPIDALLKAEVPIAISTDCNPGTSPIPSILSVMNMACTLFKIPPENVLAGVTKHAAKALGLENHKGQIKAGYDADFVIWDIDRPADLCQSLGFKPSNQVVLAGNLQK